MRALNEAWNLLKASYSPKMHENLQLIYGTGYKPAERMPRPFMSRTEDLIAFEPNPLSPQAQIDQMYGMGIDPSSPRGQHMLSSLETQNIPPENLTPRMIALLRPDRMTYTPQQALSDYDYEE